jgi:putative ABC transport system substrate-binding protein
MKNRKLVALSIFAFILATTGTIAVAQDTAKIPRIGLLYASPVFNSARIEAFRQGLRELGYIEGKNIVIEYRYAEGKLDRYAALAAELVRLNVDVIVTGGPGATRPTKKATAAIPIVMAQDPDPVSNGFVTSLARPGGNITGLSTLGAEISGKQVKLLKEIVPRLSRVAVVGTSTEPSYPRIIKETELAARAFGIDLQYSNAKSPTDFETAFHAARTGQADAILVLPSFLFAAHLTQITRLALQSRLPAIYAHGRFAEAGGLMSYGVSYRDLDRRAATFVDKILKGSDPANLPIEQPTKFNLLINLKTAKVLGLTIPPELLMEASRVIE